jgi:hypothetical protein
MLYNQDDYNYTYNHFLKRLSIYQKEKFPFKLNEVTL